MPRIDKIISSEDSQELKNWNRFKETNLIIGRLKLK